MVSVALLLRERDQPMSDQTFSGCCDTLIAKRKDISIAVSNIDTNLKGRDQAKICRGLATLAEGVCVITETTAQAVFMVGQPLSDRARLQKYLLTPPPGRWPSSARGAKRRGPA